MRIRTISIVAAVTALAACAVAPTPSGREATPFATADGDIRLTISPDGGRALWGVVVGRDPAQLDIVESVRTGSGWSAPRPVPFNTPQTDFDPSFAPDGRSVLFFSSRPGGAGGDDLYVVSFDPATGAYGEPQNLGAGVNTSGDEWAPMLSADGRELLFASDGHGGSGKHDLFIATRVGGAWATPVNLGDAINTSAEDFDATFLEGGRSIVFAQGNFDDELGVRLMLATRSNGEWRTRGPLAPEVNCADFVNGPSVSPTEPGVLYFSAACEGGRGRSDIWRAAAPRF
ncbi:hypothetical protein [Terricaulis sp.]|uniref:hypothetical protein n=1 Tax=Terricaulis sp. TaxID=2768686 RepID=UPI0037834C19